MIIKRDRENFYILNFLDKFMEGHKGFIVGGCFKNIFNHEKVKDIDIFFENQSDYDDAINYFDSMTPNYEGDDKREEEYFFHYENDNVKAYKHKETGIVLELCQKVFGKPKEILENFDFTITKFAYYKEEVEDDTGDSIVQDPFGIEPIGETNQVATHIEYKILCDDKFFEHLHLHRLVTDDKILYPMSTFERTIRYVKYGYMPCKETKLKIAQSIQSLTKEQVEVGQSLYDGMD